MRLHSILAATAALMTFGPPAVAMEKPFRVSLIGDAYTGDGWMTGVKVEMDDGWKTYWRMPGESGVPPEFTWTTSVPADVQMRYPLPGRYKDASGETIGYKHEVVFPVLVQAGSATGVRLDLSLFFAVCKDICIPADAKASVELGPAARDPDGSRDVERWMVKVPLPGKLVTEASVETMDGKPVLRVTTSEPVDDLFIETEGSAYFRKPEFSADGRQARLVIDNIKDPADLKGKALKITMSHLGMGLEQDITLP